MEHAAKIVVTEVTEHEDGSATFQLDMDDDSTLKLAQLGVELIIYCAAADMDIQDVFDWMLDQAKLKELQQKGQEYDQD